MAHWINAKPGEYDLIIDEVHRVRNIRSATFKRLLANWCYKRGYNSKCYALTGTPVVNSAEDLLAYLAVLGVTKQLFGSQSDFRKRYCGKTWDEDAECYTFEEISDANLLELNARLKPVLLRRRKADVLTQLPAMAFHTIPVAMQGPLVKPYMALVNEYEYLSRTDDPCRIGVAVKMRALAGELKINAALNIITGMLDEGEKIVVFAHHHAIQERLFQAFTHAETIFSSASNEQRLSAANRFQTSCANLLIAGTRVAGEGINLTKATAVLFVELDWTDTAMQQACARIHRIGQLNDTKAYVLLLETEIASWCDIVNIDVRINNIAEEKRYLADIVVDGAASAIQSM